MNKTLSIITIALLSVFIAFLSYILFTDSNFFTKNGKTVNLSLREFDLLAYLCEHSDTAISKDKLLSEVWGTFSEVMPTTLAVHIRWLREKLEDDPAEPKYLKTVYKMGYILELKN